MADLNAEERGRLAVQVAEALNEVQRRILAFVGVEAPEHESERLAEADRLEAALWDIVDVSGQGDPALEIARRALTFPG